MVLQSIAVMVSVPLDSISTLITVFVHDRKTHHTSSWSRPFRVSLRTAPISLGPMIVLFVSILNYDLLTNLDAFLLTRFIIVL